MFGESLIMPDTSKNMSYFHSKLRDLKLGQKALVIGLVLVVLLTAGCAGIEPYEPRNNREEGLEKGLFTGSEGEWVIFRKTDKPEIDSEADRNSDEMSDSESEKVSSEEKKAKTKSGEQQP
jgi:hypothetical protein